MTQETQSQFFDLGEFHFDSGETLQGVQLAWESYGTMNADKSNVILLNHALTGSHHAHGLCTKLAEAAPFWQPENHEGWWNRMIGPGKPLDTQRYYIICINYLGSCYGSSGPCSPAPDGEPWGSRFPLVTAADQARAFMRLIDSLGVERVQLIGPSVGGLIGLATACLFPERIKGLLLIGVSYKPSVEHQLSIFEQILAIELDENFCAGRYSLDKAPQRGLALARIICHKLFVDQRKLARRARAGNSDGRGLLHWYQATRNTESYMLHQGHKFAKRFDANAYMRIVHMWSHYNLAQLTGCKSEQESFRILAQKNIPVLLFSISTDDCFLPRDISAFHRRLTRSGVASQYYCINSQKGHDSFLLEPELYEAQIEAFLQAPQ